jgi:hypothetical protein
MSYHVVPASPPLWLRANAERWTPDRLLSHFGVGSPPVDVIAIARGLGAEVHFMRGSKWEGAVDSRPEGSARIFVRTDGIAQTRQRFCVAHETGHLLLHEPGRAYRDDFSSSGQSISEIQANNFAANLLMPSWLVNAYATGGVRVAQLAKLFDVSQPAMEIRLKSLGYSVQV